MTGLAGVLAAHTQVSNFDEVGDWHPYGCDCSWSGSSDDEHRAHVVAAVTAWLAERLGGDEVRHKVGQAVIYANLEHGGETGDHTVDAALAAVVGALAGES